MKRNMNIYSPPVEKIFFNENMTPITIVNTSNRLIGSGRISNIIVRINSVAFFKVKTGMFISYLNHNQINENRKIHNLRVVNQENHRMYHLHVNHRINPRNQFRCLQEESSPHQEVQ